MRKDKYDLWAVGLAIKEARMKRGLTAGTMIKIDPRYLTNIVDNTSQVCCMILYRCPCVYYISTIADVLSQWRLVENTWS